MSEKQYKISKEKRTKMIALIKDYLLRERNEELGDLAANMILDFFTDNLAKEFYNQGINDSYEYLIDHFDDVLSLQKL